MHSHPFGKEKAGWMLGFKESCDTAKELINEILEIE